MIIPDESVSCIRYHRCCANLAPTYGTGHAGRTDIWPKQPDGIVGAQICSISGLLPGDSGCTTRFEYFIKGTVPTSVENLKQSVLIDKDTGDLVEPNKPNAKRGNAGSSGGTRPDLRMVPGLPPPRRRKTDVDSVIDLSSCRKAHVCGITHPLWRARKS